ncbi:hypothetical protein AB6N23_01350 [Cellulomonas sp. 179-A 9B4 NHS]|uniref:hypothetical protein n=1 Tax=Cellulomonas sp. 179-A 9B4 NHS TaxID=3142379 RepID=UPI0039A150D6
MLLALGSTALALARRAPPWADVVAAPELPPVLERWDARPPWQAGWEDRAELVYRALDPEDAILTLYGNPDEPGGEIDLSGMRHVRVVVLARGRYDSEDDDDGADLARPPVEQWLVQLYPDPVEGGTNPLGLEPPRLAQDQRLTASSSHGSTRSERRRRPDLANRSWGRDP